MRLGLLFLTGVLGMRLAGGLCAAMAEVPQARQLSGLCNAFKPIIAASDYSVFEEKNERTCRITLTSTPDCPGATACTHGHLFAERGLALPEAVHDPVEMEPVDLAHGITGYFYNAARYCAVGCDSYILWEQDGIIYQVGLKYAELKPLRRLANRVIHHRNHERSKARTKRIQPRV